MDFDSNKLLISLKSSLWHHALILLVLLVAFSVTAYLFELTQDNVRRSVHEWLVTLAIKFLNFCIAKSLLFRNVELLQAQPSLMSSGSL